MQTETDFQKEGVLSLHGLNTGATLKLVVTLNGHLILLKIFEDFFTKKNLRSINLYWTI